MTVVVNGRALEPVSLLSFSASAPCGNSDFANPLSLRSLLSGRPQLLQKPPISFISRGVASLSLGPSTDRGVLPF